MRAIMQNTMGIWTSFTVSMLIKHHLVANVINYFSLTWKEKSTVDFSKLIFMWVMIRQGNTAAALLEGRK